MVTMSDERPDGVLLLAQSNAGLPQLVGDEFRYGGTPGGDGRLRRAHGRSWVST